MARPATLLTHQAHVNPNTLTDIQPPLSSRKKKRLCSSSRKDIPPSRASDSSKLTQRLGPYTGQVACRTAYSIRSWLRSLLLRITSVAKPGGNKHIFLMKISSDCRAYGCRVRNVEGLRVVRSAVTPVGVERRGSDETCGNGGLGEERRVRCVIPEAGGPSSWQYGTFWESRHREVHDDGVEVDFTERMSTEKATQDDTNPRKNDAGASSKRLLTFHDVLMALTCVRTSTRPSVR